MAEKLSEPKPATSIDKWDQYKQKICNDILIRKLKVWSLSSIPAKGSFPDINII